MSRFPVAVRRALFVVLLVVLTACSSSGGDGAPPPSTGNPSPINQNIAFAQAGPLALEMGQPLTNAATGGAGTGAVTYSSSNPSVASVSNAALVTAIAAGSTVITATKAADAQYAAATASYLLNVVLAAQTISFVQAGPASVLVGAQFANSVNGVGTGVVTYASSNIGVATVDANGVVTGVNNGSVTISATKAADGFYAAAHAGYLLSVIAAQALAFTQAGPITLAVGDTLTNPASSLGSGNITYTSSNTQVATVSASGVVTALATGSAIITADKAADSQYAAASANYAVNVNGVAMNAWIGVQNTLVDFSAAVNGFELYRSSEANCDITNYLGCAEGQLTVLNGAAVTDTAATLTRAGYYVLKHGSDQSAVTVNSANFSGRFGHQIVTFSNRLWLIAGGDANGQKDDVWSSSDGITWVLQAAHASFGARSNHQALVYNNQMWIIGGLSSGFAGDVWASSDGSSWVKTATLPFGERYYHQAVVYNNRMLVIGGRNLASTNTNDVWSSTDGVTWNQETAHAAFSERYRHQVVVYNNKMWLIAGCDRNDGCNERVVNQSSKNDVWSSTDGITWALEASDPGFTGRQGHRVVVHNNKMWLLAGSMSSGVMASSDGIVWTNQFSGVGDFSGRMDHAAVAYRNRLWVIGGFDQTGVGTNDVWSTVDGSSWTPQASGPAFSARGFHQIAILNNQLWLTGGGVGTVAGAKDDVWSSSDGVAWKQRVKFAPFQNRAGHAMVEFNGELWLIGGGGNSANPGGNYKNDVWSSADGSTWTQRSANAAFSGRSGHRVVVYNNQLWLIGGYDGAIDRNDVWASADGVTWTQKTAIAAFSPRSGYQIVVYSNKLWLIGGTEFGGFYDNDVWSSVDGVTWTQVTPHAPFSPRMGHQAVVYNNKLWVIGGYDVAGPTRNDVWSSTDGINWTQETANAAFSPRYAHNVVVYNNQLLLVAGTLDAFSQIYYNDVWSSTDGIEWRQGFRSTFEFP